MTSSVVRGDPYPSQVHLQSLLQSIQENTDDITLPQLMYHCLREHPDDILTINAATGEQFTKAQILKRAVPVARALVSKRARGRTVIVVMRNHQHLLAVYNAVLFAGTLPFMMDPTTTVHELTHFIKLVDPYLIFCDEEHRDDVTAAVKDTGSSATMVVANGDQLLEEFATGESDDLESFNIPAVDVESPVMLLPTSGSTGLPKAAIMSHRGVILQIPCSWPYHKQFPSPTPLVMLLTSAQWMTFTMLVTSSTAYRVPLLLSPKPTSVASVLDMLTRFKPSWTFFGPAFASALLPVITEDHFSSLETLILLGAPTTIELLTALKEKLPKTAHLCDGYGTTETQGFIALQDREAPLKSNGYVVNILHYKLIDENGKEVGIGQSGELYVKGVTCIKGYYNNEKSYKDAFIDSWYRTGDKFFLDENRRLRYEERIKFNFKFRGCHVAPEEVEGVINGLPEVVECAVCGTAEGAAAAVVLRPHRQLPRDRIHEAVAASLSDHKRLHGGIAFVAALPHTSTGKLRRGELQHLMRRLKTSGQLAC